jgi:23S rRNA (cytidine1920-2'-O)/16S rRNA (cytidine1409-2'-O)-methyltransferase
LYRFLTPLPRKLAKSRKRGTPRDGNSPEHSVSAPKPQRDTDSAFVSRGGVKLAAALDAFQLNPTGASCADLGCNVGGFTDCLLQHGARRVYAIDTGHGALDYELRKNERVIVMERTNALHIRLHEQVDLVVIDVGWTRQRYVVPAAASLLKAGGRIITLIKPQYEVPARRLQKGVLPADEAPEVLQKTLDDLARRGFVTLRWIESPIKGDAGNREFLALINPPRVNRSPDPDKQAQENR